MKRQHWGEFEDDLDKKHEVKANEIILPNQKAAKLKKLKDAALHFENQLNKIQKLKLKNPLVTQTIEVMNQTEMLQTLIDAYASKSGYNNYVLNPCQMIPQVDFPPENAANLLNDDKFVKPFWFIPPFETDFSRGKPKSYPKANQEISRYAIRKSICGLLRIAGFNDASHSSLVLFTDAVDEFYKNLLNQVKDIQINENKDKSSELDILTLERGYHALMHNSLLSVHNYFKNDIIAKNLNEIDEFKETYQEYDKLMKESQNMQKMQFKDEDYMNFLDFTGTIGGTTSTSTTVTQHHSSNDVGNVNLMNLLENENHHNPNVGNYNLFDGDIMKTPQSLPATPQQDDHINFTVTGGPPSLE